MSFPLTQQALEQLPRWNAGTPLNPSGRLLYMDPLPGGRGHKFYTATADKFAQGDGTGIDVNEWRAKLGIDQVNNTTDADKPISTATQAALNQKLDTSVYVADAANRIHFYPNISALTGAGSLATITTLGVAVGRTVAFTIDGRLHIYRLETSNDGSNPPEVVYPNDRGTAPNNKLWRFMGQMGSTAIDSLAKYGSTIRDENGGLLANGIYSHSGAVQLVTASDYELSFTNGQVVSFDGSSLDAWRNGLGWGLKADLASPAFTGNPTATTQANGNRSTRLATTQFVGNAIDILVGGAPGALDALNELAAALGNDPNFAATMTAQLAAKLDKAGGTMTGVLTLAPSSGVVGNVGADRVGLQVMGDASNGAFLALHRAGVYAGYFGLDTDNKLKWGGWSMGNVAYEIHHEGNFNRTTLNGHVGATGSAHGVAGWSDAGFMSVSHFGRVERINEYNSGQSIAVNGLWDSSIYDISVQLQSNQLYFSDSYGYSKTVLMDTNWSIAWKAALGITNHVGFGGTTHPLATNSVAGFQSPGHKVTVDRLLYDSGIQMTFASGMFDREFGMPEIYFNNSILYFNDLTGYDKVVTLHSRWASAWKTALSLQDKVDKMIDVEEAPTFKIEFVTIGGTAYTEVRVELENAGPGTIFDYADTDGRDAFTPDGTLDSGSFYEPAFLYDAGWQRWQLSMVIGGFSRTWFANVGDANAINANAWPWETLDPGDGLPSFSFVCSTTAPGTAGQRYRLAIEGGLFEIYEKMPDNSILLIGTYEADGTLVARHITYRSIAPELWASTAPRKNEPVVLEGQSGALVIGDGLNFANQLPVIGTVTVECDAEWITDNTVSFATTFPSIAPITVYHIQDQVAPSGIYKRYPAGHIVMIEYKVTTASSTYFYCLPDQGTTSLASGWGGEAAELKNAGDHLMLMGRGEDLTPLLLGFTARSTGNA